MGYHAFSGQLLYLHYFHLLPLPFFFPPLWACGGLVGLFITGVCTGVGAAGVAAGLAGAAIGGRTPLEVLSNEAETDPWAPRFP